MIQTLRGFLVKEFKQALRDPRMRILLFLAPVIQLTLFGVAISNDVKNIRLWAPLSARDTALQHIYTRAVQGGWFLPSGFDANADPYELLRGAKIDAALVPLPGGLTRNLGKGSTKL